MTDEYVLWGFHPAYADGVPIKLWGGTLQQARYAQRQREGDGDWTLAIYRSGTDPEGLRAQWREAHGNEQVAA